MISLKTINQLLQEQWNTIMLNEDKVIITLKVAKSLINAYKVYTLTTHSVNSTSKEILFEYSVTSKDKESAIEKCLYETLHYFMNYFYERGKYKTDTNK